MASHWTKPAGLSDTTPHETPPCGSRRVLALARWSSLAAQSPAPSAATTYGAAPGWKVPRTPDGHPDLQGVWGNNSVTPMTRPRQWKDKASLTDAEVEELKQFTAQVRRPGRRRDLRQLRPADARRQGQGRVRPGVLRSDHRQLQPVLDGRSRVGQPHVAHHRSARRPVPAADARGRGAARGGAQGARVGASRARSVRRPRRPAAVGALHLVRRAAHRRQLQQLRADHPVAARRRCCCRR